MNRTSLPVWASVLVCAVLSVGCNLLAGIDDFHVTGGAGGGTSTGGGGTGGVAGSTTSGGASGTTTSGGSGGVAGSTGGVGGSTGGVGGSTCMGCPEPPGDCEIATCNDGVCGVGAAPDLTPAKTQIAGDCKQRVCVSGAVMDASDDADPPEIPNDCKIASCLNGGVTYSFEVSGAACGNKAGMFCDGNGVCYGCAGPADCVDPGACQSPTCTAMACGTAIDASDPASDGNDCTIDACTGPVPIHTSAPAGTTCEGGARACDGNGNCIGQACPDGSCPTGAFCVDGVCCDAHCEQPCEACTGAKIGGDAPDGHCAPVMKGTNPDGDCAGEKVCTGVSGAASCQGPQGAGCVVPEDCISGACADGVCCDGACTGVCQACDLANNVGVCKPIPNNQDPENECAGAVTCNGTGACGNLKPLGSVCGEPSECQSGVCVDGVCCDTACSGACESCALSGKVGTCTPYGAGTDPETECVPGQLACDGAGACKALLGQLCAAGGECISGTCADSVCCNAACTGTCEACNLAATKGTCTLVPAGQDPNAECAGTVACDGAGKCAYLSVGAACQSNAQCETSACVDGYCCESACSGQCKACSGAKTGLANGQCGNVVANTDPDNECATECGGAGACEAANGAACSAASQCQSGYCADGVCCDKTCSGTCKACSAAKKGFGSDGVCEPIKSGNDPDGECADQGAATCGFDGTCNGAGACRKYLSNGFKPVSLKATVTAGPKTAVLADVNNDGKLDVVASFPAAGKIGVFLGDGLGNLGAETTYVTGIGSERLAVADFNGDGFLDIATTSNNPSNVVLVLLNKPAVVGTFNNAVSYPLTMIPFDLLPGDVTGDGKPDLIVGVTAAANAGGISVLLNGGNGAFGAASSTTGQDPVTGLALGELNNDGKLDVVTSHEAAGKVVLYPNNGTGGFPVSQTLSPGAGARPPILADMDLDSRLDLVVPRLGNTNAVYYHNDGNLGFTLNTINLGTGQRGGAVGLLNPDAYPDVVVAKDALNQVTVMLSDNGPIGTLNATSFATGGTAPLQPVLGDVTGDGTLDIVISNSGGTTVAVLSNQGNGTFAVAQTYAVAATLQQAVLGDLNNDGRPDVVTAVPSTNQIGLLVNKCQ